ncbi:hypothetical protein GCM10010218_56900 [Streptomyces mashuensis]|uniref:ATP nucleotide 3'-pyrophosphokinase n=1 Tax=Streptomyces mashuensis TaxID=33904 RepID=A0A919EG19_9ACTN|nr:ATP nucleotide 3'-pyrophosphokinase [Streptomyces mashuensis]GHF67991.1 hypothetical protein GCM10010218_56900 [Streptomyces mashuensis]
MTTTTPVRSPLARTTTALALALALAAAPAATAAAGPAPAPAPVPSPSPSPLPAKVTGQAAGRADSTRDGWSQDGLHLSAADERKVNAYAWRAGQAERAISPQVRAAAVLSHATLVGFDQRLKSKDSLKRKVATSLREHRGQTVEQALASINDAVRYTFQWQDGQYTAGVTRAASVLAQWGNDSARWKNTWGSKHGYKGINSVWRAPRSGQPFEIQFHTAASKHAQQVTHKLYEEQRLPGTSPARKKELQRKQDAVFAAVPVPAGAARLTAPARQQQPSGPRG